MTNSFYTPSTVTEHTTARGSDINAITSAVETAFDKLPTEANIKQGTINFQPTDTGSANTYVIVMADTTIPISSYPDGFECSFRPANNSSGASTLNVNSIGATAIKQYDGTPIEAGDISTTRICKVRYNSTAGFFTLDASTDAAASAVTTTQDAIDTAADVVSTNADVVSTGNDKTATNADVVSTNADVVTTTQDAIDTAADVVSTNADKVATNADAAQTALDRIATAADKVSTNADVVTTTADAVTTTQDAIDTAADATQTALDRIQTGLDRTAASNSATAAALSATAAAAAAAPAEEVAVAMAIALG